MKIQEKGLVWVLILTMVAHFESSCDSSKATPGPNGTASGYYQLHQNKEAKYDGKLSVCQKGSSNDVSTVHQCTLAMMQYQFQHQNGLLFSPDSYWDVLRPNGKSHKASHIRASLQRIRLCNPTTT